MSAAFERIAARIREAGPIPFAEYMRLALYDPRDGFYARAGRVGPSGDFTTSPAATPEFGRLLARGLVLMRDALGRPSPFGVVEGGAGPGHLAREAVAALGDDVDYWAVEWSDAQRAESRGTTPGRVRWVRDLDGAAPRGAHVVVANELLDNLPAHRYVVRGGEPRELLVGVEGTRLVEAEGPPLRGPLRAFFAESTRGLRLEEGARGELSPQAAEWVARAARLVARGYLWLFDYGGPAREVHGGLEGFVKTYRAHRAGADPFEAPGEADITVAVDWDAAERAAARHGFRRLARGTQRAALLPLGAAERIAELSRAGTADAAQRAADLRDQVLGAPGAHVSVLLLAKDAPAPFPPPAW